MFIPGHLAVGYLITILFLSFTDVSFNQSRINMLIMLGTLFGLIPDIDMIYFFVKNKALKFGTKNNSHRNYFTHAPATWIILSLIIYFSSSDIFIKQIATLLLLGTTSHFILDSIEYGVMWLWPFSKRRFMMLEVKDSNPKVKGFGHYWKILFRNYKDNVTFYLEVVAIVSAVAAYLL